LTMKLYLDTLRPTNWLEITKRTWML
jgi:hypothetical protein